jgi:hypothetical protein
MPVAKLNQLELVAVFAKAGFVARPKVVRLVKKAG